jgi:hypothetical protein
VLLLLGTVQTGLASLLCFATASRLDGYVDDCCMSAALSKLHDAARFSVTAVL